MLIPGTNSIKDTGYTVANSCRFNSGDSARMHKTPGSTSNQKTWTYSAWIKRGTSSASTTVLLGANVGSGNRYSYIGFSSSEFGQDEIQLFSGDYTTGGSTTIAFWVNTNDIVYRDFSAWYHIVVSCDLTEGSAGDVLKVYVNNVLQTTGVQESNATVPNDSTFFNTSGVAMEVGALNAGSFFDGYMAEVCWIDGTALTPSSFGEFDEDSPTIWKPIDVSGLTFGTNGFYLDMESSGNLGNDANGGTDFTEVNLAATDQATDTPTNNFATLNPLDNEFQEATFSEGNCKIIRETQGRNCGNTSTIAVASGKWYCEVKYGGSDGGGSTVNDSHIGIVGRIATDQNHEPGHHADEYAWNGQTGDYRTNDGHVTYGNTWTTNDIIGIHLDLDNNKLYFSKNGTLENSGTGISISATPHSGVYWIAVGTGANELEPIFYMNFGGCSAFTISSGNTDDNGYGNFEYSPDITGDSVAKKFYALNTKNLAEFGG